MTTTERTPTRIGATKHERPEIPEPNPALRYAPLASTFAVGASVLTHLSTRRKRPDPTALEFVEALFATFFLARFIAHEKAGSVVREPFVEPVPGSDPADGHGEFKRPTGGRLRYSIGELVTCTRCLGPWAASAVTFSHAFAPKHARLGMRVFALAGANIIVQSAHAAVCKAANREAGN